MRPFCVLFGGSFDFSQLRGLKSFCLNLQFLHFIDDFFGFSIKLLLSLVKFFLVLSNLFIFQRVNVRKERIAFFPILDTLPNLLVHACKGITSKYESRRNSGIQALYFFLHIFHLCSCVKRYSNAT